MFDLERWMHTGNAARGKKACELSAEAIRQAPPEIRAKLMPLHRELAGRTMASHEASKEQGNG
jgi:hypothetical protein